MSENLWSPFEAEFPEVCNGPELLIDFARDLAAQQTQPRGRARNDAFEGSRRRALGLWAKCDASGRQIFVAAVHVLADLAKQGWGIRVSDAQVEIARPENGAADSDETRERIRSQ